MALRKTRRYAFHMKPGCGPTIEGLLVEKSRREFVLLGAEIVQTADTPRQEPERVALASTTTLFRENVFIVQEIVR